MKTFVIETQVFEDDSDKFLRNFYRNRKSLFGIFTHKSLRSIHPFIGAMQMEIAYIVGALAIWAAMALMVMGFQKLEKKPQGERP